MKTIYECMLTVAMNTSQSFDSIQWLDDMWTLLKNSAWVIVVFVPVEA